MAADCTISNCGVQAVGRCSQCGEAFCASHAGAASVGDTRVIDYQRCGPCDLKARTAYAATSGATDRSFLEATAVEKLRAANVPTVRIYTVEVAGRYRRLYPMSWPGAYVETRSFIPVDCDAWLLGEFDCEWPVQQRDGRADNAHRRETRPAQVVVKDGHGRKPEFVACSRTPHDGDKVLTVEPAVRVSIAVRSVTPGSKALAAAVRRLLPG